MTYHVVPHGENGRQYWAVKRSGNKRVSSTHHRKATARRKAEKLARKNNVKSVVLHRRDGTTHRAIQVN